MKDRLCAENGVILIRIHHTDKNTIEERVLAELKLHGVLLTGLTYKLAAKDKIK